MTLLRYSVCLAVLLSSACLSFAQEETDEAEDTLSLSAAGRRSAAVASILDRARETPAEQLSAIFTLLELGETDVAAALWKEFDAAGLAADDQAALVSQFGVAKFLQLARQGATAGLDGARSFVETCLDAAAEQNRDPQRLDALIQKLTSESATERTAARSDLAVTGDQGAKACLEALARADDAKLRTELLLTLAQMRPTVEPLLLAAIADGRGQFRRDVVELTGYLHLQDAVPWLAALASGADGDANITGAAYAALQKMGLSAPQGDDARAVVLSEIQRLEAHQHPPTADEPWWTFDSESKQLQAVEVSTEEQQTLRIARLAELLSQLPSATAADRRLGLIYAYQAANAFDEPLSAELQEWAKSLPTNEISEMLHEALEADQVTAAIACTRLLAERSDIDALRSFAARPSPLARALEHPDRQLRFAALETIMKLAPQQSFAGASGVPKALWYFAAGADQPQAVAASSVATTASQWAGQLRSLGFDATPVATGREAMRQALASPRLELILVDSDINRPLLREVIYQLRSSKQLRRVPIAVLSSIDKLPLAEQIAAGDPWLLATPRPHGDDAMQEVLDRLAQLDPGRPTAESRGTQAAQALQWLGELLAAGHPYDELLRDSELVSETLYNPSLAEASLKVLGSLGTAQSQQLLLDYISTGTLPIESRSAAAEAFATSVQRFGKLLTSEQLLRQYDRYNASETADEQTQQVLGSVLDVLEKQ